jgi:hypothetical protein
MAFRWSDSRLVHRLPVSYLLAMQSLPASRRPRVYQATTAARSGQSVLRDSSAIAQGQEVAGQAEDYARRRPQGPQRTCVGRCDAFVVVQARRNNQCE